jgi:hypothetical protein
VTHLYTVLYTSASKYSGLIAASAGAVVFMPAHIHRVLPPAHGVVIVPIWKLLHILFNAACTAVLEACSNHPILCYCTPASICKFCVQSMCLALCLSQLQFEVC